MTPPMVSVIVLCYRHARYVRECLDSVAGQTFRDFELIVCDDASDDDSVAEIAAWIESHGLDVQLHVNTVNRGICWTLNRAVAAARGRYVSIVAADDRWLPGKLALQVACAESAGSDTAVVYSDALCMDEQGTVSERRVVRTARNAGRQFDGDVFLELAVHNFVSAPATLVRTDAIRAVGGYDERLMYEDYDMWLRLAMRWRFAWCDAIVAHYREHASSMTNVLFAASPPPAVLVTDCLMAVGLLRSGRLTPALRRAWATKLQDASYSLYRSGSARAAEFLWQAATWSRSRRWMLLALLASLRIPHRLLHYVRTAGAAATGVVANGVP